MSHHTTGKDLRMPCTHVQGSAERNHANKRRDMRQAARPCLQQQSMVNGSKVCTKNHTAATSPAKQQLPQ